MAKQHLYVLEYGRARLVQCNLVRRSLGVVAVTEVARRMTEQHLDMLDDGRVWLVQCDLALRQLSTEKATCPLYDALLYNVCVGQAFERHEMRMFSLVLSTS